MKYLLMALWGFLGVMMFMTSCMHSNQMRSENSSTSIAIQVETDNPQSALKMMERTCYACHNPKVESLDDILAPPLAGIKMRYQRSSVDREDFIHQMSSFVHNPSEESAKMKGPVRRFGLMPKTALNEDEVRSIVAYIYDNEIEEPEWFKEHEQQMHGKNN